MSGKAFLDTNLFIYMQSSSDADKKELSYQALEKFDCVASTQVLSEFCNVAFKKLGMTPEQVQKIIRAIGDTCDIAVVTQDTVGKAVGLKERYGFSYYDSLIVAAALESGCAYLLSEDMSDGQVLEGGLEIVNIFTRPDMPRNTDS
jgi:predicted nucleic acid-binding protein